MFCLDPVPCTDCQRGFEGRPRDGCGRQELRGEGHGRIHPPFLFVPAMRRKFCYQGQSSGIFANHPYRQHNVALADSQHGKSSTEG